MKQGWIFFFLNSSSSSFPLPSNLFFYHLLCNNSKIRKLKKKKKSCPTSREVGVGLHCKRKTPYFILISHLNGWSESENILSDSSRPTWYEPRDINHIYFNKDVRKYCWNYQKIFQFMQHWRKRSFIIINFGWITI